MRARRVDANLEAIVKAARKIGFLVNVRNDDLADLDVQLYGVTELWELKDGRKPPSKRKLTKRQADKRAKGWRIRTITSEEDVPWARLAFGKPAKDAR